MQGKKLRTCLLAAVVFGSGVVNLLSVVGPPRLERYTILRGIFPLEFLHLSRFVMLWSGFILVISSMNIYKRKRRALQIVLVVSALSVVFHLTKGLDYEEACFSAILLILLRTARGDFVVESIVPDLRWGFGRLAAAMAVAFLYGVAGFWLLDTREFGINFTLGDALHRSFLFFTLVGDPGVVPRTVYARWFLNSLYVMTLTAMAYSVFAVFRPVLYRYGTLPHERRLAEQITAEYGRSALDFFKYWPDKSFIFSDGEQCFLSFRVGAGYAVVLGDPVGPEEEIEPTIRRFLQLCEQNDWRPAFYQTLPDFLPIYGRLGFRKLKVGDDAIVDLTRFTLEGRHAKKLRYAGNQAEKLGIRFEYYPPPVAGDVLEKSERVSEGWLQIPGRRERGFGLGKFEKNYIRSTPLYAAVDNAGDMFAFVNVIPSFHRGETTIDLMRYVPDAPHGIMDFVFSKLFLAKKQEGYERFNMGMAPMAGFREDEDASMEERAVHYFLQRLNFLYSYQGLHHYKAKFATLWEPRYLVYRNVLHLPGIARALARVSEIRD